MKYRTQETYEITVYSPGRITAIRDKHFPDLTEKQTITRIMGAGMEAVQEYELPESPTIHTLFGEYQNAVRCTFETSVAEIRNAELSLIDDAGLTIGQQEALTGIQADSERLGFKAGFQYAMRLLAECGVKV